MSTGITVFLVIAAIVAVIRVVVRIIGWSDSGHMSWDRKMHNQIMNQQQMLQQQEQQRLFQEDCDRQGRAFQKQQWDFQNEQFRHQRQDFNRFNDFHQF